MKRYALALLFIMLGGACQKSFAVVVPNNGFVPVITFRDPLPNGVLPVMSAFNFSRQEIAICAFSVDLALPFGASLDCVRMDLNGTILNSYQQIYPNIDDSVIADMAFSDDGNIYVAASNTSVNGPITLTAFSSTGGLLFPTLQTGGTTTNLGRISLVALNAGLWLVYSSENLFSNNEVFVQIHNLQNGSVSFGPQTILSGAVCAPTAATNSNQDVAITWVAMSSPMGNCSGDIMARVYRDNVAPITNLVTLSNTTVSGSSTNLTPSISASDTGLFSVAWSNGTNVLTSRMDFSGSLSLFSAALFNGGVLPLSASGTNNTDVLVANPVPGMSGCQLSGRLALAGELEPNVSFAMGPCGNDSSIEVLSDERMLLVRSLRDPADPNRFQVGYNLFPYPAEIAVDGVSLAEGDPQLGQGPIAVADVTLTRPHPSGEQVDVSFFTRNGTALAGEDFGAVSGTTSFPAGSMNLGQSIQIPIIPDNNYEDDESFTINLSSPINAVIKTDADIANILILNDDAAPDLINNCMPGSTDCQTVAEPLPGNSTSLEVVFTITEPQVRDITFNYATQDVSATAGTDYIANSGTAQIIAGTTQTSIILTILGDDQVEDTERFNLVLTAPASVTISQPVLSFAISDDTLCFIEIDPTGHNVPVAGGDRSFTLTTADGCAWNVASMVPWAQITSATSGVGTSEVGYSVDARNDSQAPARFGEIVAAVTTPTSSVTHTIEQDGDPNFCQFNVTPDVLPFTAAGGSASIAIATIVECGWEVFSDDDWLSIDSPLAPVFGDGTVQLTVAANVAAANVSTPARSSVLDAPFAATVQQEGCSFELPVSSVNVAAQGDAALSAMIFAPSSAPGPCPWTAVSNSNWILVTQGTAGSGGGQVLMDVLENPSVQARTGTVQIGDDVFTVNQAGQACDYLLQPAQISVCPDGGQFNVDVFATAGCSWELAATQNWLTATSNANGIGDEIAILQNAANLSESSRQATLNLQEPGSNAVQSSLVFNQDGFLVYEPFDLNRPSDWGYTPDNAWSVQNGRLLGQLQGVGVGSAIDQSSQGACSDCKVEASVSLLTPSSTGEDALTLVGWYLDSANFVGLAMDEFNNRWALMQMAGGNLSRVETTVDEIIPNREYQLAIRFNGSQFSASVDGVSLMQLPVQNGTTPIGYAGVLSNNHTISINELRLTGAGQSVETLLQDSFEQINIPAVSMCTQ